MYVVFYTYKCLISALICTNLKLVCIAYKTNDFVTTKHDQIAGDMTYPSRKPRQPILHNFLFKALENPKQYGNMIKWVDRSSGLFEVSTI